MLNCSLLFLFSFDFRIILVLLFFLFATLTVVGLCTGLFKNHGSIVNYLRSLTWTTAWSELMSESSFESKSRTSVLYGLRTIIMFWIIMVHTAIEVNFQFFRKYKQADILISNSKAKTDFVINKIGKLNPIKLIN